MQCVELSINCGITVKPLNRCGPQVGTKRRRRRTVVHAARDRKARPDVAIVSSVAFSLVSFWFENAPGTQGEALVKENDEPFQM